LILVDPFIIGGVLVGVLLPLVNTAQSVHAISGRFDSLASVLDTASI